MTDITHKYCVTLTNSHMTGIANVRRRAALRRVIYSWHGGSVAGTSRRQWSRWNHRCCTRRMQPILHTHNFAITRPPQLKNSAIPR